MSFYECLCLCECFQGVMGGIVEHFLRGSYGKRDITKLVIDSFPWGQLIRFCHRSSAKRSECIDKNERLKTNQMVRPASVVHARKTQMQNKENNILFLFQMLEESVDTRRRLRHRVLIAALIAFAQGRSAENSFKHLSFLASIQFCLIIHILNLRPERQRRSAGMDLQLQHQSHP